MSSDNKNKNKIERIPIITILGHVDHGKTTILDKIRNSNVQEKEVGGITQKISVFTIEVKGSSGTTKLSFVDTPGHEAFDLMRKRGGDIADVVLLIIAADDGIKPQTEESIEIIKNSNAHPIVVFNKMDLPNIDLEKIKRDLANKGIQVEGYGGNIPCVEVSGKTGNGIDNLLETISLLIEVEGIKSLDLGLEVIKGKSYVLESIKDQSKGFVSTVIVTAGSLNVGDWLVYMSRNTVVSEKIKGFITENNESLESLSAGEGGKIIGVSNMLDLGAEIYSSKEKESSNFKDLFIVKKVENLSKKNVISNVDENSEESQPAWFADFFETDTEEKDTEEVKQTLNILIKASSEGSLQAITSMIKKIDVEGYKANIVNSGVGDISLSDVENAEVTKSIILAFEVKANSSVKKEALNKKVLIREYDIIYRLSEEVTDVLTAMSTPKETEEELGDAQIKEIFVLSNGKKVLGGRVANGIIKKNERCYVVRDDEIIGTGKIVSLKHSKNDINESQKGTDFGAIIDPTPKDVEIGDSIYCFKVVK